MNQKVTSIGGQSTPARDSPRVLRAGVRPHGFQPAAAPLAQPGLAAEAGLSRWFLSAHERGNAATRLDSRHPHGAAWTAGNRVRALSAITNLGGRAILFWLVTVTVTTMLIHREYRLTVYLAVTGLGALALDPTIKLLVGRLRPVVPTPFAMAPGNSFPSGHALDATVFYGVMLPVFLPIIPPRLRKLAVGLVVTLVLLVGFSRVAIGVHYPSDVVGGWPPTAHRSSTTSASS